MKIQQLSRVQGRGASLLALALSFTFAQIFAAVEFREEPTDFFARPGTNSPTAAFRAEGADYAGQLVDIPAEAKALKFFGQTLKIDKSRIIDAEKLMLNLDRQKEYEENRVVSKLARDFAAALFSGTNASNQWHGLGVQVDGSTDVPHYTGNKMTIDAGSLDVSDSTNDDAFIELLTDALAEVPDANALVMRKELYSKIQSIARRSHGLTWQKNEFGMDVPYFDMVPLYRVPDSAIALDATAEAPKDTSLFVIRFAENDGVAVASNAGFIYEPWEAVPGSQTQKAAVELYGQPVIEADDAIRRIKDIAVGTNPA
jgi:hypothetical protein